MTKNLIIVVLIAFCIGLAVLQLRQLGEEPTAAPAETSLATSVPEEVELPAVPALPVANASVETLAVETVEVEPLDTTPIPVAPDTPSFDAGSIADMMERPEFRKAMVAQQKMVMEQQYGELFDMLELAPEDRTAMKDLLAERMGIDMEMGVKAMQAGRDAPAEDLLEEFRVAREEAQEAIKLFLGDEDFALFEQYEATQPERMQVDLFKQGLGTDDQLTWEQEDELVRVLHEARTSFSFSTDMMSPDHTAMPTPDQMQVHMKEMARLNEQLIVEASQILTPSQSERFRESVESMAAMQEMAFGMAQKMFGGDSESE